MQAVAHKTRNHNALHQAYIMLFFQAKQQLFTSFFFNLRHCKMLLITVSIIHCHNSVSVKLLSGQLAECYSSAVGTRHLLERYSTTVPANTNYIWWNAVPPAKYLVERRSTAFPLHYSTGGDRFLRLIRQNAWIGARTTLFGVSNTWGANLGVFCPQNPKNCPVLGVCHV